MARHHDHVGLHLCAGDLEFVVPKTAEYARDDRRDLPRRFLYYRSGHIGCSSETKLDRVRFQHPYPRSQRLDQSDCGMEYWLADSGFPHHRSVSYGCLFRDDFANPEINRIRWCASHE
jgi:hypothetical protein